MRKFLIPICGLMLWAMPAMAADNPKAIVEKSIKAMGGMEKVAKYKAAVTSAKGTIVLMDNEVEFGIEMSHQYPDRMKNEIKIDAMGMSIKIIQVYRAGKGWMSIQGNTMELEDENLDDLKNEMHSLTVESLAPLLVGDTYKLELIGEAKVSDKPAVGVRVSAKGHKDISLFFDKESGLLVKTQKRTKEAGVEVDEENFYSDFKEIDGVKLPMTLKILHDGKKFLDAKVTEAKLLEKLDDDVFAKP
jgi:hypothetical protein